MRRVALAALLALCACASTHRAPRVGRRLGGSRIVGHFVSPTSYEHFIRGELAAAQGRWDEAVDALRLASLDAEDDPLVLARLAHALRRAGRAADAERSLSRALERFPASEPLWLERGDALRDGGDAPSALEAYQSASRAAPRSFAGVERRVELLRASGAPERARELLERFAAQQPAASRQALRAALELALDAGDATELLGATASYARVAPLDHALSSRVARALAQAHARADESVLRRLDDARREDRAQWIGIALACGAKALAAEWIATTPPGALGGLGPAARLSLEAGDASRALDYAVLALATEASAPMFDVAAQAALELGAYARAADYASRAVALQRTDARDAALSRALFALGL